MTSDSDSEIEVEDETVQPPRNKIPKKFKDRLDPLNKSDAKILKRYRLTRAQIIQLYEELDPHLRPITRRSKSIPNILKICTTLRLLGSGNFQHIIASAGGFHQSTVSRCFNKVLNLLYRKALIEIKLPETGEEILQTKTKFRAMGSFEDVIGIVDGTHILTKPPRDDAPFINRRGQPSINAMVVCNANGEFTSCCVRYPGSSYDSYIWAQSECREQLFAGRCGDGYILADNGYPLEAVCLTPILNPTAPAEEVFNREHKSLRERMGKYIALWKSRFKVVDVSKKSIQYFPQKTSKIILATMLLHNYCQRDNAPLPNDDEDLSPELRTEVQQIRKEIEANELEMTMIELVEDASRIATENFSQAAMQGIQRRNEVLNQISNHVIN